MSRAATVISAMLLVAGCTVGLVACRRSVTVVSADPSLRFYHAYGDSITTGFGLSNPNEEGYPALLARKNGLTLTNDGYLGDQACDVPERQIFGRGEDPSIPSRGLYSILVGTNDVDLKGVGAYETVFNRCQRAAIGWLALPREHKIPATLPVVKTEGSWSRESGAHWNAMVSNARGASISFPLDLPVASPIYLWYRIYDGSMGTFNYAIDGVFAGVSTSGTAPVMRTQNATSSSFALLRLEAVPAGRHTLVLTQTSDGPGGMGIVAVGMPGLASRRDLPRVLVGTLPRQRSGDRGACAVTNAPCLAYDADIRANAAVFANDGLDVRVFDSARSMTGSRSDLTDYVHPNALGHQEIFQAMEDALR